MEIKAIDKMVEKSLITCIDTGLSTCWGLKIEPSKLNRVLWKYGLIFKLNDGLEDFSKAET
ncbi:MAG TPA: hypothetical protein ENN68_02235 [Methanomicrobia archaeon]|nr:hypothetical protein [Methanomicrobia archaeon]